MGLVSFDAFQQHPGEARSRSPVAWERWVPARCRGWWVRGYVHMGSQEEPRSLGASFGQPGDAGRGSALPQGSALPEEPTGATPIPVLRPGARRRHRSVEINEERSVRKDSVVWFLSTIFPRSEVN